MYEIFRKQFAFIYEVHDYGNHNFCVVKIIAIFAKRNAMKCLIIIIFLVSLENEKDIFKSQNHRMSSSDSKFSNFPAF
jgi:hypothetical protein